jgi:hypothetical protein
MLQLVRSTVFIKTANANDDSVITTLNGAVTDVTATSQLSEADGRTILSSVEAIEPTILDALTNIVVKKPAFVRVYFSLLAGPERLTTSLFLQAALPIGGLPALILQDLKNLKTATVAFANGLVSIAPVC